MEITHDTCHTCHTCSESDCHTEHDKCVRNFSEDIQEQTEDKDTICKSVGASTKYYQRNKVTRTKVHKCPHCDYETTGPKQTLVNHINAKHKEEKDKPFYCKTCDKGFAQAANYEKHMQNIHNKVVKVTKTREERKPYVYMLEVTGIEPSSKNTISRVEYYKNHKYISASNLGSIKYNQCKFLTQKDLHYDKKNNYVKITVFNKSEFQNYYKLIKKLRAKSSRS